MQILNGKILSKTIQKDIKEKIEILKKEHNITPALAVILVGDDPASQSYVKMKARDCKEVGIYAITHEMPEDIAEDKILETIEMMNNNPNIDGILIQLPLPKHINTIKILETVTPKKDVDGFHPFNVGRVVTGLDGFIPCTPLGVIKLLDEYNINIQGKNVVIVGASNIVGKPLASLLLNKNATVEICHIYTDDLKKHTLNADILCVGVGKVNLITEDMVKDEVIIIDIGINRLNNGKLVGDVDFENVSKKASYITPVPGGVGPMTIAMLLSNTLKCLDNVS
jgi:methylenetetrahydrofolate dehydrogenase (NADP+)/methenyltetrahydrofolate cyclohydrolase